MRHADYRTGVELTDDPLFAHRIRRLVVVSAVALGVIFGVWGNTNQVNATLTIHDKTDSKLLWKYDYVASGSVGSSTESLSKALMRNASKKFPYQSK